MKLSDLSNYINSKGSYNTTHLLAWMLASRCTSWTLYNWLYMFRPPTLLSVSIKKNSEMPEGGIIEFEPDMFFGHGILKDTNLNHYIYLEHPSVPEPFYINAGYILSNFALGDKYGYQALRNCINRAAESAYGGQNRDAAGITPQLSAEGSGVA